MAALRTGLANERSANIDETHSRLDEHHVERLWVGVSVSENTPSETFFEASSTHPDVTRPSQAERNTVDPVRGARRQRAVKRAKAPPRGRRTRARVIGGGAPAVIFLDQDSD